MINIGQTERNVDVRVKVHLRNTPNRKIRATTMKKAKLLKHISDLMELTECQIKSKQQK